MAGRPARRAVWRWAGRLLRRDWRQQVLIGSLLSLAVAIAAFGVSASYHVVPDRDGEFGSANHRLHLDAADKDRVSHTLDALREWFPSIEVIAHRDVRVPGSTELVDVRTHHEHRPLSAPMLGLASGRYPRSDDEIAVTDRAAELLQVGVGSTTDVTGGRTRVVGLVENPANLDDDFILSFETSEPDRYTVLVESDPERVAALPSNVQVGAVERRPACHALLICASPGQSEQTTAAVGALVLSVLLLLLVALIATAGFVVIAQRRLRELGMFAAIGGTDRQLARVVLANGLLVGLIASVFGSSVGIVTWIFASPLFESAAGHRIDRLDVPWLIAGSVVVLGTVAAVIASSKPARALKRTSIVAAVAARPPRPRPVRRSTFGAAVLVGTGVFALDRAVDQRAEEIIPAFLVGGIAALLFGTILVAPGVLGAAGRLAGWLPVGARIAFRDLARYRARSSTALAAISLAVAIPAVAIAAASAAKAGSTEGNLSERHALIRIGDDPFQVPEPSAAEMARLTEIVTSMATEAQADLVPLRVAVDPALRTVRGEDTLHAVVVLGRRVDDHTTRDVAGLYVATPALAATLDLPASVLGTDAEVLTPHEGRLEYANVSGRSAAPRVRRVELPHFTSMPTSLITRRALRANEWQESPAGWFLEAERPITDEVGASLREAAAGAGLTVELRDKQQELGVIRSAATGAGSIVALGVLALSLSILRVEAQGDLRVLAAAGAPSSIRRAISAARGVALAGAGALLGVGMAYMGLVAGYGDDRGALGQIPLLELSILLVGLPVVAFTGSWVLAGGSVEDLRRAAIE